MKQGEAFPEKSAWTVVEHTPPENAQLETKEDELWSDEKNSPDGSMADVASPEETQSETNEDEHLPERKNSADSLDDVVVEDDETEEHTNNTPLAESPLAEPPLPLATRRADPF